MHTGGCVCNRLGPKALLLLGQSGGIVTTDVYRKFCPRVKTHYVHTAGRREERT